MPLKSGFVHHILCESPFLLKKGKGFLDSSCCGILLGENVLLIWRGGVVVVVKILFKLVCVRFSKKISVDPYRAILRYNRCDTPYRAISGRFALPQKGVIGPLGLTQAHLRNTPYCNISRDVVRYPFKNSDVPKRGRSKRGRTQMCANVRKRAQMSAKERKRKSAKQRKRA